MHRRGRVPAPAPRPRIRLSHTLDPGCVAVRRVAWACAFLPIVAVASLVTATALTPGYSSISDTVSQLAVDGTPRPWVLAVGLLSAGSMLGAFAWALHRRLADRVAARTVGILIAVSGIAVGATGLVRDDPNLPHGPATLSGIVHGSLASIAFAALMLALFRLVPVFRAESPSTRLASLSIWIGATCAVVGMVFELQVVQPIEGLLQRAFVALFVVWMEAVVFGYLLRGPEPGSPVSREDA